MTTNKTKQFNLLLSTTEYEQLKHIASIQHCSMGQSLRLMLQHVHRMIIDDQPTCANGQICAVPQLHPRHQPTDLNT